MSTNTIVPKVVYSNIEVATLYNYNVPVNAEVEIVVELLDADGVDVTEDIEYTLDLTKSMGSLLYDTNTITVTWVGVGDIPAVNTLNLLRRTNDSQISVFDLNADLSVETARELDRLTRFQQDINDKVDEIEEVVDGLADPAALSVDTADIVDLAVTEAKIAANAVTTTKISNGAVTSNKLGNLAVTAAKIAVNAVTEAKILDGVVTEGKLGADAVTEAKLADNAVSVDKIVDASITLVKLNSEVTNQFNQKMPFKLLLSTVSTSRVRIEAAELSLNDSTKLGVNNGKSLIVFDGLEIDFLDGETYTLAGASAGSLFNPPLPSNDQYRTYLIQATFGPVNSVGKTPLVLQMVGGQQDLVLGDQVYPTLETSQDISLGYVTIQESGGVLADIVASNLVTLNVASSPSSKNIFSVIVGSHTFNVGNSFIPVYWNGTVWLAADSSTVTKLATHLIIDVLSTTEFTVAYSGRIHYPAHGLDAGGFYFLGADVGLLNLIEADDFSNPMLQVEDDDHFTLLGWRANEKTAVIDVSGAERFTGINLVSSTPTEFTATILQDIYSITVYNTTRKMLHDEIEVRIDDSEPTKFTLFSSTAWTDLRVDLVGVK